MSLAITKDHSWMNGSIEMLEFVDITIGDQVRTRGIGFMNNKLSMLMYQRSIMLTSLMCIYFDVAGFRPQYMFEFGMMRSKFTTKCAQRRRLFKR